MKPYVVINRSKVNENKITQLLNTTNVLPWEKVA